MSNKVAIVTDSTSYLPEEHLKQYNITVTPLSIIWGIETLCCLLSPVIGTHVGPGTIALNFMSGIA